VLATPRSSLYLRWRYGAGPLPYYALAAGDPPSAFVILRLRERGILSEAVVCEALFARGGEGELAGLLKSVPDAAGADHAIAQFGPRLRAHTALAAARFRRIPRSGLTFVARPVAGSDPDPRLAENWALTLGDLELF